MLFRTRLVTLAIAATGIGLGACSSTIHDSERGAYVYERPWMKSIEQASINQVYDASQQALEDLDLRVQNREQHALDARLTAEEADGTNVRVDLEKLGDNSTRVAIKVGTFGDQSVARMVLDKIRSNLESGTAMRDGQTGQTQPAGFRERDRNLEDDEEWLEDGEAPAQQRPREDLRDQPQD